MPTIISGIPMPTRTAGFDARRSRQEKKTKAAKIGFAIFMILAMLLIVFILMYVVIMKKAGSSMLMPGVAGSGILMLIGTKLFGNRAFGTDEKRREAEVMKTVDRQNKTAENLFSALPEGYIVFRNLNLKNARTGENVPLETVVLGESGVTLLCLRQDKGVVSGRMENESFRKKEDEKSEEKTARNPVRTLRPAMLALQDYLSDNGFRVMIRGAAAYTDPSVKLEVAGTDPVSDIRLFACPGCESRELTEYLTDGLHRMPPQTIRSITELLSRIR